MSPELTAPNEKNNSLSPMAEPREAEKSLSLASSANRWVKNLLPRQRMILALILLADIALISFIFLLATGKVSLPG
jgi:hypothetical protein